MGLIYQLLRIFGVKLLSEEEDHEIQKEIEKRNLLKQKLETLKKDELGDAD